MKFIFFYCLLIAGAAIAQPQYISLDKTWSSSITAQWVYDVSINHAPPFRLDQSHDGLLDLIDEEIGSSLCFPTALSQVLIHQKYFQKNPLSQLKLASPEADNSKIDANLVIREMSELCKTDIYDGTHFIDGAACIEQLYIDSGYPSITLKMIRNLAVSTPKNWNYSQRKVEIDDIIQGIDQGFNILASVRWMMPNLEEKKWQRDGGHIINIFGYARQIPWKDMILLYVSNPLDYSYDGKFQAFDTILLQKIKSKPNMAHDVEYSDLVLDGKYMNGLTAKGFIGGLTLFKVNE